MMLLNMSTRRSGRRFDGQTKMDATLTRRPTGPATPPGDLWTDILTPQSPFAPRPKPSAPLAVTRNMTVPQHAKGVANHDHGNLARHHSNPSTNPPSRPRGIRQPPFQLPDMSTSQHGGVVNTPAPQLPGGAPQDAIWSSMEHLHSIADQVVGAHPNALPLSSRFGVMPTQAEYLWVTPIGAGSDVASSAPVKPPPRSDKRRTQWSTAAQSIRASFRGNNKSARPSTKGSKAAASGSNSTSRKRTPREKENCPNYLHPTPDVNGWI